MKTGRGVIDAALRRVGADVTIAPDGAGGESLTINNPDDPAFTAAGLWFDAAGVLTAARVVPGTDRVR